MNLRVLEYDKEWKEKGISESSNRRKGMKKSGNGRRKRTKIARKLEDEAQKNTKAYL